MNKAGLQTRLESALESVTQTAAGFVLSFCLWMWVVAPLFGITAYFTQGVWITAIFTVSSLARQYIFRRFFNAGIHMAVHSFCKRFVTRLIGEYKSG